MAIPPYPDFRSAAFLRQHLRDTMAFYDPVATDASGGQYHFFLDDGTVYDTRTRHLVSATRFVVTHAMLYRTTGEQRYQAGMLHALQFLRTAFLDPATGGYAWLIDWNEGRATVQDATRHCYGMAFVMLAYARAFEAGVPEAREWLAQAFDTAEQHFWQPAAGLYADEADTAWQLTGYRGQNANMHACEALISAFRATGERRYIERAEQLAQGICQRQAALSNPASAPAAEGWVWEHFHADWSVDWDYNRHDRSNIFRPWGYQIGHQTEWAKLLLQLDALLPADWHLPCAQRLFDAAVERGWDADHGGMYYGMAPDGSICDDGKYHWVQAESLAAAAVRAADHGAGDEVRDVRAIVPAHDMQTGIDAGRAARRQQAQVARPSPPPAGPQDARTGGRGFLRAAAPQAITDPSHQAGKRAQEQGRQDLVAKPCAHWGEGHARRGKN